MTRVKFVPAESDPFETPEYRENGLNETLRIDGVSYIYDVEYNLWIGEMNDALSGSEIHEMILEGVHRVLPWTPLDGAL